MASLTKSNIHLDLLLFLLSGDLNDDGPVRGCGVPPTVSKIWANIKTEEDGKIFLPAVTCENLPPVFQCHNKYLRTMEIPNIQQSRVDKMTAESHD